MTENQNDIHPSTLTPEYKSTLIEAHQQRPDWGKGNASAREWRHYERKLQKFGSKTLLDYGCACGLFKPWVAQHHPQYEVFEYDPGIPGKDRDPEQADYVICCDVLEHVEPDYLQKTLEHIKTKYRHGAFMVIAIFVSRFILPDNRQAHLIIQPGSWWIQQLGQVYDKVRVVYNHSDRLAVHVH